MSYIDKWRKNNSGKEGRNKNLAIEQMCEDYKSYLYNAPNSATFIKYYDKSITGLCTIIDVNVENSYGDEKYITTLPDTDITVGDLIYFKDARFCEEGLCWIIRVEEGNVVPSHKKFRITPCKGSLNIMTNNGLVSIPSYFTLTTSRMSNYGNDVVFKNSQPINYTQSSMISYMSAENAKKYIYEGMRYLLPHNGGVKAYKINFIDCTKPKIVTFQAEETPLVAEDNLQNLIAYNENITSSKDVEQEYVITGEDKLNREGIYRVENAEKVEFALDDLELAKLEMVSSNECKVIGIKSKQYVRLIATCNNTEIYKDILIVQVGEQYD